MIIKNNFFNKDMEYLKKEREGLNQAINKLDKRLKNKEISHEKFLKQNEIFAKKQINLLKREEKLNRK